MSPLLAGLRLLTVLRKNRFPNLETDASTPGQPTPDLGSRFSQLEVGDGPPDVAPPPPDNWVARPPHVDGRPDGSSLGMDSSAPPDDVVYRASLGRASWDQGESRYVGFNPSVGEWEHSTEPNAYTTHAVQRDGSVVPHKYVNPHVERMPDGSVRKFSSYGSYPIFHVTRRGEALCHECTTTNDEENPHNPIVQAGTNEGPAMPCSRCGSDIEGTVDDEVGEDEDDF